MPLCTKKARPALLASSVLPLPVTVTLVVIIGSDWLSVMVVPVSDGDGVAAAGGVGIEDRLAQGACAAVITVGDVEVGGPRRAG